MDSRLELNDYTPMVRKKIIHSRIGNCEGFFFTSLGAPIFVLGPQCNFYTGAYFLIYFLSSSATSLFFLLVSSHLMNSTVKVAVWILWVANVIFTIFTGTGNPGVEIQPGIKQQEILKYFSDRKYCRVCEVIREEGCLHCIECDLCVNSRHFHSSVMGKCIGKGNYYAYLLSFVALGLTAGTIFLTVISSL